MKHLSEIVFVLCVTAVVGGCGYVAYKSDEARLGRDEALALECVKAGNQWISSWGKYECVAAPK